MALIIREESSDQSLYHDARPGSPSGANIRTSYDYYRKLRSESFCSSICEIQDHIDKYNEFCDKVEQGRSYCMIEHNYDSKYFWERVRDNTDYCPQCRVKIEHERICTNDLKIHMKYDDPRRNISTYSDTMMKRETDNPNISF